MTSSLPPSAGSTLSLPLPADLDLPRTVCSYGYFLLAPNHWDHRRQQLRRVFRGEGLRRITAVIHQPAGKARLQIRCDRRLSAAEAQQLKRELTRMLRVKEDPAPWWRLHPAARRERFGRLFRSADLWEDMVKTVTSCNTSWANTMTMNRLLCERVGGGGFPTPQEVADFGEERLRESCRVGYRAERLIRLARGILAGDVDLAWYEAPQRTGEEIRTAAGNLYGFGRYAAANLAQLLGHFDRLAIDSELIRHYCQQQKLPRPEQPEKLIPQIDAHYARYGPYRFMAYWFEMWQALEARRGPAWRWNPDETARGFVEALAAEE